MVSITRVSEGRRYVLDVLPGDVQRVVSGEYFLPQPGSARAPAPRPSPAELCRKRNTAQRQRSIETVSAALRGRGERSTDEIMADTALSRPVVISCCREIGATARLEAIGRCTRRYVWRLP